MGQSTFVDKQSGQEVPAATGSSATVPKTREYAAAARLQPQPISSMNRGHVTSSAGTSQVVVNKNVDRPLDWCAEFTSQDESGEPFQLVTSNRKQRRRNKRLRVRSAENIDVNQTVTDQNDTDGQQLQSAQQRLGQRSTRRLMVGKKQIVDNVQQSRQSVLAANPFLGMAVYCVDNVATGVSENDLRKFMTDMNIHVISCFKVAPRKPVWWRKDREYTPNRNTFRVCIPSHEKEQFLNAENWPEYITISTWVFMNKQRSGQSSGAVTQQDTRHSSRSSHDDNRQSLHEASTGSQQLSLTVRDRDLVATDVEARDQTSLLALQQDTDDMDTTVNYGGDY
jgi:hypothetical protein